MQRKMTGFGGAMVYDLDPPYRPWSDNQSTYLFFPVFIAFVLSLISTLSAPIISGVGAVKLDFAGNGTITVGTWGWCAEAFVNATCAQAPDGCANARNETAAQICSGKRPFGVGMDELVIGLPQTLKSFASIASAVHKDQLDASGALQIISVIANWMALTWTLAACGEWEAQREDAWRWTRWAFGGNIASGIFLIVQWALTLSTFTAYQKHLKKAGLSTLVKVKPGASIFMLMGAFIVTLAAFLTRLLWSRRQPRPLWSLKDRAPINAVGATYRRSLEEPPNKYRVSDPAVIFATASQGGTPDSEELPPTWESLDIDTKDSLARGEKPLNASAKLEHGVV